MCMHTIHSQMVRMLAPCSEPAGQNAGSPWVFAVCYNYDILIGRMLVYIRSRSFMWLFFRVPRTFQECVHLCFAPLSSSLFYLAFSICFPFFYPVWPWPWPCPQLHTEKRVSWFRYVRVKSSFCALIGVCNVFNRRVIFCLASKTG